MHHAALYVLYVGTIMLEHCSDLVRIKEKGEDEEVKRGGGDKKEERQKRRTAVWDLQHAW